MNVIIIEDEEIASNRLKQIIYEVAPDVTIIDVLSSVSEGTTWLNTNATPDLIFFRYSTQ